MQFRHMGGAAFADLQDESGTLQVYFGKKTTEKFAATKKIDLGDIIGVRGLPFVTKTGQVTLEVTDVATAGQEPASRCRASFMACKTRNCVPAAATST